MGGDCDVKVWLGGMEARPGMVIPYVQSEDPKKLQFSVRVVQEQNHGTTQIAQSGSIDLSPKVPTALSRFSLSTSDGARCEIEVILTDSNMRERRYSFECPS